MAIEVFNRYEQKYLLTRETFLKVNEAVKQHMEPDAHSAGDVFYPICNIYYDTEDCALIRASVAKPAYKEKLRLRSYGRAKPDDLVYLEIKKKYGKNAILKGMNLQEGATTIDRNKQIGGHKA